MNCSVCSKKIGLMDSNYSFSNKPESEKERVCQLCKDTAVRIQDDKFMSNDIDYYENYMRSPTITPAAKEYFSGLLNKSLAVTETVDSMLVTSGFDFDGYTIEKYLGFVYSQTAMGMGYFKTLDASLATLTGNEATGFQEKMDVADKAAIDGIFRKAAKIGGNAIIGLTLNHSMFTSNLVGIVATGTAVIVDKVEQTVDGHGNRIFALEQKISNG